MFVAEEYNFLVFEFQSGVNDLLAVSLLGESVSMIPRPPIHPG